MAQNYFLYARKSSDSEERQVLSIEAQLTELKQFAEKEGLRITRVFQEAMTAKEPGRPIFNDMVSRIEKGEAQGIIAWHPDRLARNSVDGGRIIYLVDTKKINFLKFPIFWFENTPQGKFMLNIAFGQSKYYVDNLSENVKRGQRQKLRRGEWPGWAPMGYLNDKNLRKVVIDPLKGSLVQKLFETYAIGNYTLQDMKKVTFEWGLVSRNNTPLVKAELHRTLTRPFYYGLMKYSGEWHEGTHEPLITKELFDKVQKVLARQSKPNKYKKKYFPLLGLATCAKCGCSITAQVQKGHHYYHCTKKRGPCIQPYLREEKFAQQISEAISAVALPTDYYEFMMAEWVKEAQDSTQSLAQERTSIEEKLKDTQLKLDRLLDAHIGGLIDQTEYIAKKEGLLNTKIVCGEKLKSLASGASGWLQPCREFLESAHSAEKTAKSENLESQREFLRKMGSNFHLAGRQMQFNYTPAWQLLAGTTSFPFTNNDFKTLNFGAKQFLASLPPPNGGEIFEKSETITKMRKG